MHKREIATLAIKLMAMLLAFQAVGSAQSLFNNWHAFPAGTAMSLILPFLLSAGVGLGMGLLVWISADSLAKRVFPEAADSATAPPGSHSSAEIMQIVIAMIGIWLVITAGPSLISNTALYFFAWRAGRFDSVMGGTSYQSSEVFDQVFDVQAKTNIVYVLVQFVIGLMFAINPSRVLNTLEVLKARMMKSSQVDIEESDDTEN